MVKEKEYNISILGSTGSIGTQTLQIARDNPNIKVIGISAYSNIELLEEQIREFKPKIACVMNEQLAKKLKIAVSDTDTKIVSGKEGLCEVATIRDAQIVVTAVVGIAGLIPTIEAIKAKKNIALANKETLVTGGHIVTSLAKQYNVMLLPVDSEHSAIFQSLQGKKNQIKKILLTASGGPFFGKKRDQLMDITPKQALNHPNWSMGAKVTIDSSTLVNKGLEVMEAKWLFDVDIDQIEVIVHRQSIVHSMVEYTDNGIIAQLGVPDMRLPIQYAITYPDRLPMSGNVLNFSDYPCLTFEKPDTQTFRGLELAYRAGREGGILPTVYNGADEVAVKLFLEGKISYLQIAEVIEKAMNSIKNIQSPSIDEIFEADIQSREIVFNF